MQPVFENTQAKPLVLPLTDEISQPDEIGWGVNQIRFRLESRGENELLVQIPNYPGWRCETDMGRCKISSGDFGMKLDIPDYSGQVTLSFVPTGWPNIFYISVLSWLGYAGYLAVLFNRSGN